MLVFVELVNSNIFPTHSCLHGLIFFRYEVSFAEVICSMPNYTIRLSGLIKKKGCVVLLVLTVPRSCMQVTFQPGCPCGGSGKKSSHKASRDQESFLQKVCSCYAMVKNVAQT